MVDKHPDTTSRFKLCAIAFKGSSVMSIGYNRPKTDPNLARLIQRERIEKMYKGSQNDYLSCNLHAESSALKKLKGNADTLLVMRRDLNGSLTSARPCNVCMAVIRQSGIKTVFYSDSDGQIKQLKVI